MSVVCWRCEREHHEDAIFCSYCEAPTRLRIGPSYVVKKELGHGQFGTVFLAGNPQLGDDAQVAVKLMHAAFPNTEDVKKELRLLWGLPRDNPNLVHVLHDSSVKYIVMEYIEGANLHQRVRSGDADRQLLIDNFDGIFRGICNGLRGLHHVGIIHRDLKPANILVTNDCVAKIVDMGLAKLASLSGGTRSKVGSKEITAPEVLALREGEDYDSKVDLWALGVIAYFIWTGHYPFGTELHDDPDFRDSGEIERAIAAIQYVRPEVHNPAIPARVVQLIEALLAKPDRRFGSAETASNWMTERPYEPNKPANTYLLSDYQRQLVAIYGKKNAGMHPGLLLQRVIGNVGFLEKAIKTMEGTEQTETFKKHLPRTFAWLVGLVDTAGWNIGDVVYYKYSDVCPYCGKKPCSQHHPAPNEEINNALLQKVLRKRRLAPADWTFSQVAVMFQEIYQAANADRSLTDIVLHLYSETSELTNVLRDATLTRSRAGTAMMYLELADVFAWLLALYNRVHDGMPWFEEEFWTNFETCPWCHQIPCACPEDLPDIEVINWRLSRATLDALDVAGLPEEGND